MSEESNNLGRLLLFGKDANLLEIRAMVLRSAGMAVDIAFDLDEFKALIAVPGLVYEVVVCCYTASETEWNEIISIANQNRITFFELTYLLHPQALIDQVVKLIRGRRSGQRDPSR